MTKITEKRTITKVKKTFSMLSQAHRMAEAEHGTVDGWFGDFATNNTDNAQQHIAYMEKLVPYLKLSDNCIGKDNAYVEKHCGSLDTYLGATVRLINGVLVYGRIWHKDCSSFYADSVKRHTCGHIIVYLEPNKPTKVGENSFWFFITTEGIIPYGKPESQIKFEKACNKSIASPYPGHSTGNMYGCTAWVIYNNNMDYLRCDDLSWEGKHTCK